MGHFYVNVHLVDQLLGAGEAHVAPDLGQKIDIDGLAVYVVVEIEDVDLSGTLLAVEGGFAGRCKLWSPGFGL